jgi:ABC-type phosphate transport system ATPase subunit
MDKKSSKRISDYVLCHLGDMAGCTTELTDDIEEILMHPHRNLSDGSESKLKIARKLARENLEYIAQGVKDLEVLEVFLSND